MIRYRYDAIGIRFKYPTYYLPKDEYAKIIEEINTNYESYKDERFSVHFTLDNNDTYQMYYFENHGFDDYNIYMKEAY